LGGTKKPKFKPPLKIFFLIDLKNVFQLKSWGGGPPPENLKIKEKKKKDPKSPNGENKMAPPPSFFHLPGPPFPLRKKKSPRKKKPFLGKLVWAPP